MRYLLIVDVIYLSSIFYYITDDIKIIFFLQLKELGKDVSATRLSNDKKSQPF